MKSKLFAAVAAIVLTTLISTSLAYATLALEFMQGGSTLVVLDNGAGDTNPTIGMIGLSSGTVVGTYTIAAAGAIGFPLVGSPTAPVLDISSLDVTNSGSPGTLRILVSQTDFAMSGPVAFSGEIGGTMTTASLTYNAFFSQSNVLFAETTPIQSLSGLSFSTSPFAGTLSGTLNVAPVFSLTEQIDVTGTGSAQLVSSDAQLTARPVVPEPPTVALLGAALIGIGGLAAWRRRRQA